MPFSVSILREAGYDEALLGLTLSYAKTSYSPQQRRDVAIKLARRGGSHAKFMESIVVWLDITAPRYWWQQFDTYRVGVTKQSESTMHTILNRPLTAEDFEDKIPQEILDTLNFMIDRKQFSTVKAILPESFLQRRIVCTNYRTLARIVRQRLGHRIRLWQEFKITLQG